MKITLLMDNPKSWYYPHAVELKQSLEQDGHSVMLVHSIDDVQPGDLALFLSCEKIIKKDVRDRNTLSLVVHSSALPKGKGWSPLTYQILEGKHEIMNTLFEAVDAVDAGRIFMQNTMHFEGHELLPELHKVQGQKINELVLAFVQAYPNVEGREQTGEETLYPRRRPEDSELDVDKTIAEQFDAFRVADNDRYPAFFRYRGSVYTMKIEQKKD